jgi:nicotinate dehydrogenase subunit B
MTAEATRREFLAWAGSGLFLAFSARNSAAFQEPARLTGGISYPTDLNAYLHIQPDGRVSCFTGKVELGQGIMTSLAQMLADDLDVSFDSVDMVMGDTDRCPFDIGTFGSLTTRTFGPALRHAAAEARAILLKMAAGQLHAPAGRLTVSNGVVTDPATSASVTYAQLVEGKRIERHIDGAAPKIPGELRVSGKSPRRKDALDKVTGKAEYTADIALPGLLYARVVRPPSHGAVLRSIDTSAVASIEGATAVHDGDLVAVLHARPDVAAKALSLVKTRFEPGPSSPDEWTIFDHLVKTAPAPQILGESGNLAQGEKTARTMLEETYLNSYVAHACLETHSATAKFDDDGKLTIWASTQTPFPLRQEAARALGLKIGQVRVITPYVGGGFGGKSASQQGIEAARLAKITGAPVQVVFTRSEEFFYDTFRPAAVVKIRAGANAAGKITTWKYQVYAAGEREAQTFYDIPNQRTESAGGWQGGNPAGMHPFAIGAWRAPSVNTNTFARESHIDALASKAHIDPVAFRLNNLTDPRMKRVLETVAAKFGWTPRPAPSGFGVGVACGIYSNTYVATMAEVSVDKITGKVQVHRVASAVDAGCIVNPDEARQQIEGATMMGLGYALTEEVNFNGGEILSRNFWDYQIPRFSWLPAIEAILIDNPETPAQGLGEPPIITMGAVIANAMYDAAGIRMRQLPMTADRVLDKLVHRAESVGD